MEELSKSLSLKRFQLLLILKTSVQFKNKSWPWRSQKEQWTSRDCWERLLQLPSAFLPSGRWTHYCWTPLSVGGCFCEILRIPLLKISNCSKFTCWSLKTVYLIPWTSQGPLHCWGHIVALYLLLGEDLSWLGSEREYFLHRIYF